MTTATTDRTVKGASTKTNYDNLPFLPNLIGETVATQPYTEAEFSEGLRSAARIERIEAARRAMTPEAVREFADLCDTRCRLAYAADAGWMMECARAKDNSGRNQLYVYVSHWLASYLTNPTAFRREGA